MRRVFHIFIMLLAPAFAYAQMGNIKGIIKPASVNKITFSVYTLALDDNIEYSAAVNKKGEFSINIPAHYLQQVQLPAYNNTCAYISPGSKTRLVLQDGKVHFKGRYMLLNIATEKYRQELTTYRAEFYKQHKLRADSSSTQYKQTEYTVLDRETKFLTAFIKRNKPPADFAKYQQYSLNYNCAYNLLSYGVNSGQPKSYFDFFSRFQANNPDALPVAMYSFYLNRYKYYYDNNLMPENELSYTTELSSINQVIINKVSNLKTEEKTRLRNIASIYTKKLSLNKSDSVFTDSIYRANEAVVMERIYRNPYIESYLKNLNGLLKDVFFTWEMAELIKANHSSYAKHYILLYRSTVKKVNIGSVIDAYNKLLQKEENYRQSVKYNIKQLPKNQSDSVLFDITNLYKGKVIYIDFWATWCGPCLQEMPGSKKLRDKFLNQEVVFLYLCVQSEERAWRGVIANLDIQGEHILLNNKQYQTLSKKFALNGIPHYVLIDKNGRIKNDNASRPSDRQTAIEITQLLGVD
ncbi:TlpA family protein disulfide reductase [Mucilaginibacter psychrotolerans]|uniref:TlpA family protein disulfide reductase n=1 Tax=Mucilaginibacter psychrotolerans TaxID=1524096 RepID=A0A4Y8SNX1_9SPHI|nr:TlpA disulfide reductase family protein [Mucilaginibacter psychrotolerans]TFF40237.1 TlpA family protein disulfide reductase [Mucilaginibacter psychrotolerans]